MMSSSQGWSSRVPLPRRTFFLMLFAAFLGSRMAALAQPPAVREYELKAVFLFRFAAFVDWPKSVFADKSDPLVIGVVGTDPFGGALDEVVHSEKVRDRAIRVERYATWEELKTCHILFISRSESAHLAEILQRIRGKPVLSVSDLDHFALQGGIIAIDTVGGHTQLTINVEAARRAGLGLSSKLLRLARLVEA